ncbi:MAG: arginase family protein [Spirochaetales bacterium]|nr:arginase family protein [Spirochaetales bacterium]
MRHSNASEAVIITSNLWYGNAMAARLTAGARVLRDLFPGAPSSHEFLVDTDASSEKRHGVRDFEVYRKAICGIRMTIDERAPDHVVLLGGGCAASIAAVAYMKRRYPRLRVVWIDAHGDLNTPASSPSGYIHGMALGIITDDGAHRLFFPDEEALPYDRVALVGQKVLDPPESATIERHGIRRFAVESTDALGAYCAANSDPVYVHLDLDVLHPDIYANPKCDIPAGIDFDHLAALLKAVADNAPIARISIVENVETDRKRVSRIVDACTAVTSWAVRRGVGRGE